MNKEEILEHIREAIHDQNIINETSDLLDSISDNLLLESPQIETSLLRLSERNLLVSEIPGIEASLFEAIVYSYGRPALLVKNADFEDPQSETLKDLLNNSRPNIQHAIQATGRIEVQHHPTRDWIGTGWLVAEDIIATNRHVAEEFCHHGPTKPVIRRNLTTFAKM